MKFDLNQSRKKLVNYWHKAPEGRYMPLKEIAAVSFGGMGVKFIITTVATMILSTGNVLIGNTIGIPPMPLYVIYLLSVISNIPLTTLRAKIVDYSHNAKGKYRPFVLYNAVPTAILAVGFVYMPYDRLSLIGKCAAVLMFNIGFQFFYNFLYDSNENLVNVLSPNTYERSDVFSVKSIVDSFAPSLINIIIPLIAKAVTGEEKIYDMRVYRAVYPPILVIGVLMTIIIHVGTKEKIVQPKNHTIHIRFIDTFRLVAKNKYFWIISLASCLGFLETAFFNVLGWMYNYQKVCTAGQYALITTIYGNASLWAMIFTPALIRRFGKKNLLVFTNILNIVFIAFMFPVVKSSPTNIMIWMFLICLFINGAVTQITVTITPSINGDIRDYQQYISGERVDGIFAVVGLIGSVWNLATGSILPAIYNRAGLNEETAVSLGFSSSNVYDVLYNEKYFRSICGVLILASVIGAAMNVIPYFFYDLTETKQKGMIAVLKIRAMLEDHNDGTLEDDTLREGVKLIEKAKEDIKKERIIISSRMSKKEKKTARENNEDIEIAGIITHELDFFKTGEAKKLVERAEKLTESGIENLPEAIENDLDALNRIIIENAGNKEFVKNLKDAARSDKSALKVINRFYKDGIKEFDESVFEKLFSQEDKADDELKRAYETKDKKQAASLRNKKQLIRAEIKKAQKQFSIYNRAVQPYNDALKLLARKESMSRIDELQMMYSEKFSA